MADLPFIDANIFLRHLTQDHPDHSPRATAFLQRIEAGTQRARTSETVVFETVFTLEKQYRQPRATIRSILVSLLALPQLVLPGKRRLRRAFALYVAYPALSFADCAHIALMERLQLVDLASFDRKMSRVPTINRQEPDRSGVLRNPAEATEPRT